MKTKFIFLSFAVFVFVGCDSPIIEQPVDDEPDYALIEFVHIDEGGIEELVWHITEVRIVNIMDSEKYPNVPFVLCVPNRVVPQQIEHLTNWSWDSTLSQYLEDYTNFDSEGKVFLAISFGATNLVLGTPNWDYVLYAIRRFPINQIEAGIYDPFVFDVEILE